MRDILLATAVGAAMGLLFGLVYIFRTGGF
jgi:hypothetical protein